MNLRKISAANGLRRTSLAIGLGLCLVGAGAVAQSTTGSIFGQVPSGNGETVLITNSSGVSRQVNVSPDGRYTANALPLGDYTVTLQHNGQSVDSRSNVVLRVGAGTEVSFDASASAQRAQNLSAVTVQANALPAIDVSNVNSTTIIDSTALAKLPLAHNAEAAALLAPGAVQGSTAYFGNYVSFGGSSVVENAYYINGFNTTDPLSGFGGFTLPYNTIDQQQMMTGGYGAQYGRSDGGVINQIGKRGTNEWHFGGQVRWVPSALRSQSRNAYYYTADAANLLTYRNDNKSWETTYDAYISGPLIKDKLFFFASAEFDKQQSNSISTKSSNAYNRESKYSTPAWYTKLDWNINDSNIIEVTGAQNSDSTSNTDYRYNYTTHQTGAFKGLPGNTKNSATLWLGKYTSYLTDNLTLTAMYGKLKRRYFTDYPAYDGFDPTVANILGAAGQNFAYTGGGQITSANPNTNLDDPSHESKTDNLRVELAWHLGDHTITAGIDNQNTQDINDVSIMSGPGYAWNYYNTDEPDTYVIGGPGNGPGWENKNWVAAPGSEYYVSKYIQETGASVKVAQRAQFIQDEWQVTDRFLLSLGLRNDQFTNYNGDGVAYLRLTKPQWAPRIGASWDVFGDSSFKVYGNAGRYFLAMPASVALRSAGSSIYTEQYYTYGGIDSNGVPQNLVPIATSKGPGAPISANNEYGQPRDPRTAAATNLSSEYQDEYILGFDKKLGDSWVYGAKATYRNLRNGIDDTGDMYSIAGKMVKMGLVSEDEANGLIANSDIPASVLFNPTKTNVFQITNPNGGYYTVPMSMQDFGFNSELKRKYAGLELYLEHPFDGRWYGRMSYLWSHSFGNTEGQVKSDIGQADVSATVDWDYAQLMSYAGGDLSNDRRHQIKAYGYFQITPEWLVSANLAVLSGSPRSCEGLYYGADGNPGLGYNLYHFCDGVGSSPGETRNPWTYTVSAGVEYRPSFANHKLGISLDVVNLLNSQRVTQTYAFYDQNAYWTVRNKPRPISWQTPRYASLTLTYDF
jgi:hypothetical protein